MLISVVRTKFVAILLGPSGVGLMGMYAQITGLAGSVCGMGLGASGTRQVAKSFGDDEQVARTVKTLRRTVWLTGGLGMLGLLLFCIPISVLSFGNRFYALPIAVLSVTLIIGEIAMGQGCILQGTRRISAIAKINVIGAINSTLISIPCFYLWGMQGIVISLILSSIATLITSWWYARRVPLKEIKLSWHDSRDEARSMLTLGAAFMGTSFIYALLNYLIRVILLRHFDLNAVGIFQAAINLSTVFAAFVLDAMATDYFPRLSAVADDNIKMHKMVNEQTEISILLTLPGVATMMVFVPLIIRILYAESFTAAVPILRWCTIGVLIRVISWPLGVVLRAKGEGVLIFITELLQATIHLVAIYFCIWIFGLNGTGIAFIVVTSFYMVLILFVVRRLNGVVWNRNILRLVFLSIATMAILMTNSTLNSSSIAVWGINLFILCIVYCICFKQLSRKSNIGLSTLLARFRSK